VEWRFLAHATDDKPGFSTAWLQQKTLQRAADCRERHYANDILAEFADEFGIAGVLSTHCVDSEDDPGDERDDVTGHMESCSLTAPDELTASHSCPVSPEVGAVGEAPPLPAIFSALKKGGFDLDDLQGESTKNTDETGAWDGVDLVSAPCLQGHAVGAVPSGNSAYLEDGDRSIEIEWQQREGRHDRTDMAQTTVRPSTPPGLLVYQPCLSVKVAEDVPSELQTMPRILETKTNRPQRPSTQEQAVPQTSSETQGETFGNSAKARLKVGLSLAHLSPKRPKGTRTRPGGRAINNRSVGASRENLGAALSRHATTCEPMSHAAPYGTAWYVNPQLWGLKSSPQLENKALDQEKENADGANQLLAHTKSMKDAIPGLFSAMRFVTYIRQQGVRMPAHLENTDRAMKADKARVRRIRTSQSAGEEDQEGEERAAVPETTPSKAWRTRVNAAITLKKQGRRKKDDSVRGKVRVIGELARGRNGREDGVGAG
ncbi:unnamed protein product, partial [Scytosiphon promiscuus]